MSGCVFLVRTTPMTQTWLTDLTGLQGEPTHLVHDFSLVFEFFELLLRRQEERIQKTLTFRVIRLLEGQRRDEEDVRSNADERGVRSNANGRGVDSSKANDATRKKGCQFLEGRRRDEEDGCVFAGGDANDVPLAHGPNLRDANDVPLVHGLNRRCSSNILGIAQHTTRS